MHSFNEQTQRLGEDFKIECLQVVTDLGITRQQIADATGYNHTTISRWFTTGDLHFPVFLVSLLNTEQLLPLARAMMEFQAKRLGFVVTRSACFSAKLNQSIEDEAAEIVVSLGKAIDIARRNPSQKIRILGSLDCVIEVAQRAKLEVENMQ